MQSAGKIQFDDSRSKPTNVDFQPEKQGRARWNGSRSFARSGALPSHWLVQSQKGSIHTDLNDDIFFD